MCRKHDLKMTEKQSITSAITFLKTNSHNKDERIYDDLAT